MKLKSIKTNAQKGFTMIELVIVIAVLGILAAFALPRFADFNSQAKVNTSESVANAINASLGIITTKKFSTGNFIPQRFDIDGDSSTTDDVIYLEADGKIRMSNVNNTCPRLLNNLLPNHYGLDIETYVSNVSCHVKGNGVDVYITTNGASTTIPV